MQGNETYRVEYPSRICNDKMNQSKLANDLCRRDVRKKVAFDIPSEQHTRNDCRDRTERKLHSQTFHEMKELAELKKGQGGQEKEVEMEAERRKTDQWKLGILKRESKQKTEKDKIEELRRVKANFCPSVSSRNLLWSESYDGKEVRDEDVLESLLQDIARGEGPNITKAGLLELKRMHRDIQAYRAEARSYRKPLMGKPKPRQLTRRKAFGKNINQNDCRSTKALRGDVRKNDKINESQKKELEAKKKESPAGEKRVEVKGKAPTLQTRNNGLQLVKNGKNINTESRNETFRLPQTWSSLTLKDDKIRKQKKVKFPRGVARAQLKDEKAFHEMKQLVELKKGQGGQEKEVEMEAERRKTDQWKLGILKRESKQKTEKDKMEELRRVKDIFCPSVSSSNLSWSESNDCKEVWDEDIMESLFQDIVRAEGPNITEAELLELEEIHKDIQAYRAEARSYRKFLLGKPKPRQLTRRKAFGKNINQNDCCSTKALRGDMRKNDKINESQKKDLGAKKKESPAGEKRVEVKGKAPTLQTRNNGLQMVKNGKNINTESRNEMVRLPQTRSSVTLKNDKIGNQKEVKFPRGVARAQLKDEKFLVPVFQRLGRQELTSIINAARVLRIRGDIKYAKYAREALRNLDTEERNATQLEKIDKFNGGRRSYNNPNCISRNYGNTTLAKF